MQIYIEGLPGIGKTELANRLYNELNLENIYLETIEVESIEKIQNKSFENYVFESQLVFLNSKLKQQTNSVSKKKNSWVSDYEIFLKTITFANHFLEEYQQKIISDLLSYCHYRPKKNAFYIFLKADKSIVLERIKKRGRKYELSYNIDFLESLENHYLKNIKLSNNLWQIIDYDDFETGFKEITKLLSKND